MPAMGGYGAGSTRTTIPIAQPQQQPAFTLPVSPRIEPPPHKDIKKVRASQTHPSSPVAPSHPDTLVNYNDQKTGKDW
jgi:hypothetical protein